MTQAPTVRQCLAELVAAYIEDRRNEGHDGNAPGHCHRVPGIWDPDNHRAVRGTKCRWCAAWFAAREALSLPSPDLVERLREWVKVPHPAFAAWNSVLDDLREAAAALEAVGVLEQQPTEPALDPQWESHLAQSDDVDGDGLIRSLRQLRADASVRLLDFDEREKITLAADQLTKHRRDTAIHPANEWERMIEQFCKDLNQAHDELLMAQGCASADIGKYDWPEWTPQANSIRWAEKLLGRKLAKTNLWTLFPPPPAEPK